MVKVVLGGGIGGLSAAYYLQKRLPLEKILILESSFRTGGWIKSRRQGTYIFEQGPRTMRVQGVAGLNTLELIEELGLSSNLQPISRDHPAALNRMIYVNGKLHTLPTSILGLFWKRSPFSRPLITYLWNDLVAPVKTAQENDESIYSFAERRFGKEIADYAISPLICGICAGNSQEISVKFLMESLYDKEQTYGSVTKGIIYNSFKKKPKDAVTLSPLHNRAKLENWNIYSFKDGLEILPKSLETFNRDNGIDIRLNMACTEIEMNDKVILHTKTGEKIISDHLISALPAQLLGKLIVGHDKLTGLLKSIQSVDVCVVNLQYKRKVLEKDGFGVLVPPKEEIPILGVIFDSCCFPQGDGTILTVMLGGHWFKKYFGDNPSRDYLLNVTVSQLETILGIRETPQSSQVNILKDCIPQYTVGHKDRVEQIMNYIKTHNLRLSLCGASYNGVGINDIIMSAKTTIQQIPN